MLDMRWRDVPAAIEVRAMITTPNKSDAERVEAALQHVEHVVALVRHASTQGQLSPTDAQRIIDAAGAFGAAVIF
jgi:hypothetical protein